MEQTDSLTSAIQSLISLQSEQVNQLRIMNSRASSGSTSTSFDPSRATSFSPYAAYAPGSTGSASPQMGTMFSPNSTTQARFDQANSYLGQANLKGLLFSDKSGMSQQNQDLQRQNFSSKTFNAGVSVLGAAGSSAAGFIGEAAMPGIAAGLGGMAVGGFVGAGVAAYTDNGLKQAKQEQNLNEYLFNNSSQYINSDFSKNTKYSGGMTTDERHTTASYIRNMNSDELLSDTDVQKMLQGFTEGDLLRNTTDQKNFEDKFKKLVENTKSGALMLNESYQSIVGLMSDMQKVGIGTNDSTFVMGLGKVTGAATGTSAANATNNIVSSAASSTQGTSLSTTKAATNKATSNVVMGQVFSNAERTRVPGSNSTEDLNWNYISNSGGVAAATDALDSNTTKGLSNDIYSGMLASAYDYNDKTGSFTLNPDKLKQVTAAKTQQDAQTLTQAGIKNMQGWSREGQLAWNDPTSRYETIGQIDNATQEAIMFGGAAGSVGVENGLGTTPTEALMAVTSDTMDQIRLGTAVNAQINNDGGPDTITKNTASKAFAQSAISATQAKTATTLSEKMAKFGYKASDFLGNPFAETSDWFDSATESNTIIGDPKKRNVDYTYAKNYDMSDGSASAIDSKAKGNNTDLESAVNSELSLVSPWKRGWWNVLDGGIGSSKDVNSLMSGKIGNIESELKSEVTNSKSTLQTQAEQAKNYASDYNIKGVSKDLMNSFQTAMSSSTGYDDVISQLKALPQTSSTKKMLDSMNIVKINADNQKTYSSSLNDVLDVHKSTEQYGETMIQTGALFKDATPDATSKYDALVKSINKDQSNIKNDTIDQTATKRTDELNQYTAYLKSTKGTLTNSLQTMAGGEYSDYANINTDGNWSDSEISTLAKTLMANMQSSIVNGDGTTTSGTASAASASTTATDASTTAANATTKAVEDHTVAFGKMTASISSEIDNIKAYITKMGYGTLK